MTAIPRRRIACASSMAIGPPPMMTRLAGGSSTAKSVSLVRYPAASSPGIGGADGRPPVQSRTWRASMGPWPLTSKRFGPVSRASPKRRSMPWAVKCSGASVVRASSPWIARTRAQTRARSTSGSTAVRP